MKWPIDDMRRLTERDLFGAWATLEVDYSVVQGLR